jgi:predicted adenine nucleotide alpha hydrolase (AANH) superfamily ATPase
MKKLLLHVCCAPCSIVPLEQADGYLNLFSVIMNPQINKMEKVVLVLSRAMDNPKILRCRDFYNVKPSSESQARH